MMGEPERKKFVRQFIDIRRNHGKGQFCLIHHSRIMKAVHVCVRAAFFEDAHTGPLTDIIEYQKVENANVRDYLEEIIR